MQTAININTGELVLLENLEKSSGGGSGVTDHAQLTGRSKSSQHPISAITDLQTTLDSKISSSQTIIETSGDSGTFTEEQMALILNDNNNVLIENGGEYYSLKHNATSYKTYVNTNTPTNDTVTFKSIYVNISEGAVNYGSWSKEDLTISDIAVVNSLDSTSTTNALSANMGRVLNEKIAGNLPAMVFDSYSQMVTYINTASADTFGVGQNIYIKTQEVPDLWVASIEETSTTYTYTTDEQFITDLNAGTLQIGYIKPSQLETQKVDLTDYVKNTDYASSTAGVIKISNTYATTITNIGILTSVTKSYENYGAIHANGFISKGTLENVFIGRAIKSTWTGTQAEFEVLTTYDDYTDYRII